MKTMELTTIYAERFRTTSIELSRAIAYEYLAYFIMLCERKINKLHIKQFNLKFLQKVLIEISPCTV